MRLKAPRLHVLACSLPLATSLILTGFWVSPSRAQETEAYTISGDDGYGIADCMKTGSPCGRVIADSWCESHGHAHVLGFGLGEDVTGAVKDSQTPVLKVAAGDVVIRCGD